MENKQLLILNSVLLFIILLALLFKKDEQPESFELLLTSSVSYQSGFDSGVKIGYQAAKEGVDSVDLVYYVESLDTTITKEK